MNKFCRILGVLAAFGALNGPAVADDKVLIMGYPERDKLPMIADAPSDEGVFKDLFTAAAAKLGMTLEIKRVPKKRLYSEMAEGKIDFYPAASYADDRADFMHWFENGLQSREVCITRKNVPLITDMAKAPAMRLAMEIGGSKADFGKKHTQFKVVPMGAKIDFDMMTSFLTTDRADMYLMDYEVVEYYKKQKQTKDFSELGLKIHPDCLQSMGLSYVGFSRKSSKFNDQANPAYKKEQAGSMTNQPSVMAADSVARKLADVLAQMKKSGETKRIFDRGMERRF